MTSDDDYEPAVTESHDTGADSAPVEVRGPSAIAEAEAKLGEPSGDPVQDAGPKMPRVWSEKSRAMFRDVVKQVQATDAPIGDSELEPMDHAAAPAAPTTPPPAAAAPAATATPSVVTPPAAAAAAPVTPPPGLPALPDMPLPGVSAPEPVVDPKLAEREAALAAREAQLAEREKLMPDRTALTERPAATFVAWLREAHGITSDDELKTALSDFVTELSEQSLGVKLPEEVKAGLESRKALRSVKVYKQSLDREKQTLAEQRAAAEKQAAAERAEREAAAAEAAYVNRIAELIAPAAERYPFMFDTDITGGVTAQDAVFQVLKQMQKLGHKPDLQGAVEYTNNYYKTEYEKTVERATRLQSKIAPKPAAAAAPASPGGAPGPAPTPVQKPVVKAPEPDPSDLPNMDRQQSRAASLRKVIAAHKAAQQRT
jgi:hypothetical protein